jgi:hypothetical protein
MKNCFLMRQVLHSVTPWLWAAVWFTLPVSIRANSVSLILFGFAALVFALFEKPVIERRQVILAGMFILFFAWHGVSLVFDPGPGNAWKLLERKLSLVVIPVIMLLVSGTMKDPVRWALHGLFGGLILTGSWLLAVALIKLASGQPLEFFTYHAFTGPLGFSAIYYSCFLSAAILYLAFRDPEGLIGQFKVPLILFFIILLMFSASKLFILITIPPVLWVFLKKFTPRKGVMKYLVPVVAALIIIIGSVPFFNRVSELKNTDLRVVTLDEYKYDTPINGLTFRMILWRFAGEILADENTWLTGTGIGSKQDILNSYYLNYGIYTGNPELGDTGYLNYNFHDQYLETLVGTGTPGLLLLFSIIIFIFFIERSKQFFPLVVYISTILFLFTESMLERQAGIVFFCLIWTLTVHSQHKSGLNHGKNYDHHPKQGELA